MGRTSFLLVAFLIGEAGTAAAEELPEGTGELADDPLFGSIAGALREHPELGSVALRELGDGECSRSERRTWIVSSDDGDHPASCIADGRGAPRCARFAGHDMEYVRYVLCDQKSVPLDREPPPWAGDLIRVARRSAAGTGLFVAPVGREGVEALWLGAADMRHYVGISTSTERRWMKLQLLGRLPLSPSVEVLGTSRATGSPSYGVLARAYDGGSGLGETITQLTIVVPAEERLEEVARFPLGYLYWSWSAEEKRRILRETRGSGGMSLRDRPHVEAELVPKVGDGTLRLVVKRHPNAKMRERFQCTEAESADGGFSCPLEATDAVLNAAGTWTWTGGAFEREEQ